MPKGHAEGVLWDPQTFPVWQRAGELGIPITIAAELPHLPGMPAVVERFPQVKVAFEAYVGAGARPARLQEHSGDLRPGEIPECLSEALPQ